jgi:hypothetical protein
LVGKPYRKAGHEPWVLKKQQRNEEHKISETDATQFCKLCWKIVLRRFDLQRRWSTDCTQAGQLWKADTPDAHVKPENTI